MTIRAIEDFAERAGVSPEKLLAEMRKRPVFVTREFLKTNIKRELERDLNVKYNEDQ